MNQAKFEDFRKRAEECVELAQSVRTPEQRTMLLHIAETWLRLAEDSIGGPGVAKPNGRAHLEAASTTSER